MVQRFPTITQRLKVQQDKNHRWHSLHQRLEAIAPQNSYAREMLELAKDPDHGDRVDFRSLEEAYQARYLAQACIWIAPVRGPKGSDFASQGQAWDLKTETSWPITVNAGYSDERMVAKIESKLNRGINVAVDQTHLSQEDRKKLGDLIASQSNWAGKVMVFHRRATQADFERWKAALTAQPSVASLL
ncbi:hypothetical protein JST97_19945 [bacterium]|nr:hypothetical protein [bacterium]